MKIILASSFNNCQKNERGVRFPVAIPDKNLFLTNLMNHTPSRNSVVVVANNPTALGTTDYFANLIFRSLELSHLNFKTKTILDARNQKDAAKIIEGADLVFLCGGDIECQLEFFNKIGLKAAMKRSAALVVGGSAGAMNLCRQVFNFPERPEQVDGRLESEYFLNGLGFFDKILVPHFNNNREIKYGESELDIFPQFILPLSRGREFLAFDDDSYILLTTKKRALAAEYFGEFYIVKDEIVSALK